MRIAGIVLVALAALTASLPAVISEEGEPGTGFATALPLTPGVYNFYMEPGGVHFFKVYLEAGQTLHIMMRPPLDQDFDLILLSPERDLIEQSVAPAGTGERVSTQAPYPGYYYVVVYSYAGSAGAYVLRVSILGQPTKTLTVTETATQRVYSYVTKPTVVLRTVTETIYLTRTSVERVYVERVPWLFIGLAVLGILVFAGLAMLSSAVKGRAA